MSCCGVVDLEDAPPGTAEGAFAAEEVDVGAAVAGAIEDDVEPSTSPPAADAADTCGAAMVGRGQMRVLK